MGLEQLLVSSSSFPGLIPNQGLCSEVFPAVGDGEEGAEIFKNNSSGTISHSLYDNGFQTKAHHCAMYYIDSLRNHSHLPLWKMGF